MPVDYGRDIRTVWTGASGDLDPYFRAVTGPSAVLGAVARRLVTPSGALAWDRDAGFDLRGMLGADVGGDIVLAVASAVEAEALKDDRVTAASAEVTFTPETGTARIDLTLTLSDAETFTLVMSISAVSVTVLGGL